jgi:hypothetical protein
MAEFTTIHTIYSPKSSLLSSPKRSSTKFTFTKKKSKWFTHLCLLFFCSLTIFVLVFCFYYYDNRRLGDVIAPSISDHTKTKDPPADTQPTAINDPVYFDFDFADPSHEYCPQTLPQLEAPLSFSDLEDSMWYLLHATTANFPFATREEAATYLRLKGFDEYSLRSSNLSNVTYIETYRPVYRKMQRSYHQLLRSLADLFPFQSCDKSTLTTYMESSPPPTSTEITRFSAANWVCESHNFFHGLSGKHQFHCNYLSFFNRWPESKYNDDEKECTKEKYEYSWVVDPPKQLSTAQEGLEQDYRFLLAYES